MELKDLQSDLLCTVHKAESLSEIDISLVNTVNVLIANNLFNWQILIFLENLEQKLRKDSKRKLPAGKRANVHHAIELVTVFRKVVQLKSFSLS